MIAPPAATRVARAAMLTLAACPDCGVPAEITERFFLPSTDGPVHHIAVQCAAGHHFRMPADRLAPQLQLLNVRLL
jgi:hypothetical protein